MNARIKLPQDALAFSGATPFDGEELNAHATAGDLVVDLLSHPDDLLTCEAFNLEAATRTLLQAAGDDFGILEAAIRSSDEGANVALLARFAMRCHHRVTIGLELLHRINAETLASKVTP